MPHTCFGAIDYHFHGLVGFVTSDTAWRLVEVTAAGGALYARMWKPVKKLLLPVILMLLAAVSIAKVQTSDVATFLHQMRPCNPVKTVPQQSPEPVKHSPKRDANAHYEAWSAA